MQELKTLKNTRPKCDHESRQFVKFGVYAVVDNDCNILYEWAVRPSVWLSVLISEIPQGYTMYTEKA